MRNESVRKFIPWAEPQYWGEEETLAVEALRSTWISGGPFVDRLERELEVLIGSPHVVASSNGTTAIHMAFLALDVQAGEEIIVPGFAFMAAANIAIRMGAKPIFADIDPDTWCITAETIATVITPRTKGIVVVHSYGNMCDMDAIQELATNRGLWLLEDAAEALGSTYRGRQAGTVSEIGTYSFHATKTITTGEGGGVATSSDALAERMALFRSHGVKSRRYWHDVAGHNFRLTNIQAAIGCGQLAQFDRIKNERARLYADYVAQLRNMPGIRLQAMTNGVEPIVWAVALILDPSAFPKGRDDVIAALAVAGIETRPGFHAAGEMAHIYGEQDLPVSSRVAAQVLSLPSSPTVSSVEIAYITERLLELCE